MFDLCFLKLFFIIIFDNIENIILMLDPKTVLISKFSVSMFSVFFKIKRNWFSVFYVFFVFLFFRKNNFQRNNQTCP